MEKCEVQTFAELVLIAERLGILSAPPGNNGQP
jgi:hypothetical protein